MSKYTKILLGTTAAFLASADVSLATSDKLLAEFNAELEAKKAGTPLTDKEVEHLIQTISESSSDLKFENNDLTELEVELKKLSFDNEEAKKNEIIKLSSWTELANKKEFSSIIFKAKGRPLLTKAIGYFEDETFEDVGNPLTFLSKDDTKEVIVDAGNQELEKDAISFTPKLKTALDLEEAEKADLDAKKAALANLLGIYEQLENAQYLKQYLDTTLSRILRIYRDANIVDSQDAIKNDLNAQVAASDKKALVEKLESLDKEEDITSILEEAVQKQISAEKNLLKAKEYRLLIAAAFNEIPEVQTALNTFTDDEVIGKFETHIAMDKTVSTNEVLKLFDDALKTTLYKNFIGNNLKKLKSLYSDTAPETQDSFNQIIIEQYGDEDANAENFYNIMMEVFTLATKSKADAIHKFISYSNDPAALIKEYDLDQTYGNKARELEAKLKKSDEEHETLKTLYKDLKKSNADLKNKNKELDEQLSTANLFVGLSKGLLVDNTIQTKLLNLLVQLGKEGILTEEGFTSIDAFKKFRSPVLKALNTELKPEVVEAYFAAKATKPETEEEKTARLDKEEKEAKEAEAAKKIEEARLRVEAEKARLAKEKKEEKDAKTPNFGVDPGHKNDPGHKLDMNIIVIDEKFLNDFLVKLTASTGYVFNPLEIQQIKKSISEAATVEKAADMKLMVELDGLLNDIAAKKATDQQVRTLLQKYNVNNDIINAMIKKISENNSSSKQEKTIPDQKTKIKDILNSEFKDIVKNVLGDKFALLGKATVSGQYEVDPEAEVIVKDNVITFEGIKVLKPNAPSNFLKYGNKNPVPTKIEINLNK